ncbi:surface-adhesin E family protein [Chromobacterium sp. IIBBL 290-4]|uniref:surface-adhesin E family protein n=1 Tax=Chromobacterium sp. IIBBL 290-4 TaxID=2953890 RepID=UPI0020B85A43|nr:surface-adhesin E family protein [Chromobacterium sp. IIBBL 290-4]UTH73189.1 hypothetical protein NKT35_16850 [Chromobacterium sp. IIBBL 290-4]
MKNIIGALFVIASFNAIASDWDLVTTSADNGQIYLDNSSIRYYKGGVKAWVKTVYQDDKPSELCYNKIYSEEKIIWYIDCINNTIASSDLIQLTHLGEVSCSFSMKTNYTAISPDSIAEAVRDRLCKATGKRKQLSNQADTPHKSTDL